MAEAIRLIAVGIVCIASIACLAWKLDANAYVTTGASIAMITVLAIGMRILSSDRK